MDKIVLRMLTSFGVILIFSLSLVIVMGMIGYAQNTQKIGGLNFQVPEGWPIEKRNGVLAPIPTEEYVLIKFKAIEEKFQTIKDEMLGKFDQLEINLENMETKFLEEIKSVQTQDKSQGDVGKDLSDIFLRLGLLESEINRLDRKITNKVTQIKNKSEGSAKKIGAFEKKINNLQTQIYRLSEDVDYISDKQGNFY